MGISFFDFVFAIFVTVFIFNCPVAWAHVRFHLSKKDSKEDLIDGEGPSLGETFLGMSLFFVSALMGFYAYFFMR